MYRLTKVIISFSILVFAACNAKPVSSVQTVNANSPESACDNQSPSSEPTVIADSQENVTADNKRSKTEERVNLDDSIQKLINDLGVESAGNNVCNTACGILYTVHKDRAVPYLKKALSNTNKRIRYYSTRCLGQINTEAARKALINAVSKGMKDVRANAAYALTWHPHREAEKVYLDILKEKSRIDKAGSLKRYAINALGEIKSRHAAPLIKKIRDNPPSWNIYYLAFTALRKIESKKLPEKVRDALDFLRKAEFSKNVDMKKLSSTEQIIKQNIEIVLPDLFNLSLHYGKLPWRCNFTPNSRTILRDAGEKVYPYIRIALKSQRLRYEYNDKKTFAGVGTSS